MTGDWSSGHFAPEHCGSDKAKGRITCGLCPMMCPPKDPVAPLPTAPPPSGSCHSGCGLYPLHCQFSRLPGLHLSCCPAWPRGRHTALRRASLLLAPGRPLSLVSLRGFKKYLCLWFMCFPIWELLGALHQPRD